MFTTGTVSVTSFLKHCLPPQSRLGNETETLAEQAEEALRRSKSDFIGDIAKEFNELSSTEKHDFLDRILILDGSPRIENIPETIKDKHMRSIRREHRNAVFERLEGWWNDEVIRHLTNNDAEGIYGFAISDKLSSLSGEYKLDNLPITFRGKEPADEIDTDSDPCNCGRSECPPAASATRFLIITGRLNNDRNGRARTFWYQERSRITRTALSMSGAATGTS